MKLCLLMNSFDDTTVAKAGVGELLRYMAVYRQCDMTPKASFDIADLKTFIAQDEDQHKGTNIR